MSNIQRQLIFAPRPGAALGPELFELRQAPIPQPDAGQVLVRNLVLSCDPAQVAWLLSESRYAPKIAVGEVMRAWGAGRVVASKHPSFHVGDRVWGTLGWQDYALCDGTGVLPLQQVPKDIALSVPLGVAGINGITAHIGLIDLCAVRAGGTHVPYAKHYTFASRSPPHHDSAPVSTTKKQVVSGVNNRRPIRSVNGAAT